MTKRETQKKKLNANKLGRFPITLDDEKIEVR